MSAPQAEPQACRSTVGEINSVRSSVLFVYKWEIENYLISCEGKETGQKLESPTFNAAGLKWRISLYPRGFSQEFKEYISIFLELLGDSSIEVKNCSLSILNGKNEKCTTCCYARMVLEPLNQKYGRNDFIKPCELMERRKNLLPNGKLRILFEIIVDPKVFIAKQKNGSSESNVQEVGTNSHFTDFEKFFNNKEFSDIKFIVEGKELFAHKNILANRSKVFAAMFERVDDQGNSKDIEEVEDVTYEVLEELVRFIYSRKINSIEKIAKDLYIAADKYGVHELKPICTESLCQISLSADNALGYLDFADTYGIDELKSQAIEFAVTNVKYIRKFTGFKSIADLHKDVVVAVFDHLESQEESEPLSKKPKLTAAA